MYKNSPTIKGYILWGFVFADRTPALSEMIICTIHIKGKQEAEKSRLVQCAVN